MHRALLLLSLIAVSVVTLNAQQPPVANLTIWRDLTAPLMGHAVGDTITLILEVSISPGYHLYSTQQPTDAVLPATFEAKTLAGLELVGGLEEEGHREVYHDKIFDADIAQFSGTVVFRQKVKIIAPQASLAGALSYQVCDDQMCIPGSFVVNKTFAASKAKKAKRRH